MLHTIKTITHIRLVVVTLALLASVANLHADDIFSFAGFTWDQRNSPTSGSLLGNGAELGGAKFSTNLPNTTTGTINFPQGGAGFDTSRSLSQLGGLMSGLRAVNLPRGNNDGNPAATNRHGIQVSWNNGRVVPNLAGIDFVVYESGSTSNGVEGVMARVRTNAVPEGWTEWYYVAPTNYQHTISVEVAFAFAFDLSAMGVPADGAGDRIQIANLTEHDRIQTANPESVGDIFVGQGKVLFDTNASNVLPDAGPFDTDRRYSLNSYDPDPFYIAALHTVCEGAAPLLSIAVDGNDLRVSWPAPSCFSLESCLVLENVTNAWAAAPESMIITNGTHRVVVPNTGASRFFRLVK